MQSLRSKSTVLVYLLQCTCVVLVGVHSKLIKVTISPIKLTDNLPKHTNVHIYILYYHDMCTKAIPLILISI